MTQGPRSPGASESDAQRRAGEDRPDQYRGVSPISQLDGPGDDDHHEPQKGVADQPFQSPNTHHPASKDHPAAGRPDQIKPVSVREAKSLHPHPLSPAEAPEDGMRSAGLTEESFAARIDSPDPSRATWVSLTGSASAFASGTPCFTE